MVDSRPPRKLPGFTDEQNAALFGELDRLAQQAASVAVKSHPPEIHIEPVVKPKPGDVMRLRPPSFGQRLLLPPASSVSAGQRITIHLDATIGALTASASVNTAGSQTTAGTVNGLARVRYTSSGVLDFISDGVNGWASGPGSDGTAALAGLAEVVLGAASASFPNGRVATDSTEIDAVLTTPSVISWALNVASVAFSKLANLAGISVLGRSASSSGVMAAITATAGSQSLQSNAAGTSLVWASILSAQFDDTVTGTLDPYLLPAAFKSGDSIVWVITGNVTLNRIRMSDNSVPPDGLVLYLSLRDQSGGSAPGFSITIVDTGAVTSDGSFRTPGQVQGTSPGPSYVMQSEEEGCTLIIRAGNWRLVGGTAAQAVTGDITIASGNGSTRDAQITAGVIVNADINASAAIALSKLATQSANTVVANATAGTAVPTAVAVGTNTVVGRVAGNIVAATLVNAQIATNTITATTQAQMAANTVKSNATAGTANESDLAVGTNTVVGRVAGNIVSAALVNAQVDAAAAIALSKLATQAAESFVGNFTSGVAVPTALAGSTVAGAGLTYSTGGILAVGAGTGLTVNANDVAVTIPLTDGDKGDITVSSSGTVFSIDAGVIVDADVNAAAAIAQTKLGAFTGVVAKASGASTTTFGAPAPVSITGGTTVATIQAQVDSIVAALVALGLATDNR